MLQTKFPPARSASFCIRPLDRAYTVLRLLASLIVFPCAVCMGTIQLHVSQEGSHSNPGTHRKPLGSIRGARGAIRRLKERKGLKEPVQVVIHSGTYRIGEPLRFTPQDSGTAQAPIVYRAASGERVVISGGFRISGWRKEGALWRTRIRKVAEGKLYFRQLFVNGRRAVRARTPNKFYVRTEGPIKPLKDRRKARRDPSARKGFRFRKGDLKRWDNFSDVTIELFHSWTTSLHWIGELDMKKRIVRFPNQSNWPVGYWEKFERYRIENCFEALDSPGEWYLDRGKGMLYYRPREGENIRDTSAVAPWVTDLLLLEGNPAQGEFIEYLTFDGLSFQYEDWRFKKNRNVDGQAHAWKMEAAVKALGLRHSAFRDCEIAHVGTHALWLGKGCRDNHICRCHIHDCGGGGIYVGEPGKACYMPQKESSKVQRNVLENNFIHHTSKVLGGSIGIWIGSSSHNKVLHNEISDFDYTGISVGWCWGRQEDIFQRGNIIEYNHIHHNVGDILSDNGAIYVLGHSPGSVMRCNVVHHIRHYPYINTSNGLYLDGNTSSYTVEKNLVYDIMGHGVLTKGSHNRIRNNVLAFCEENGIWRLADKANQKLTIGRNIILQKKGLMISGYCHPSRFAEIDRNVYWTPGGQPVRFHDWSGRILKEVPKKGAMDFTEWQKLGHDRNSLVADPRFADPAARNFELEEGSPAEKIGFEEWDCKKAGLTGEEEWTSMPDRLEREPHEFAPPP